MIKAISIILWGISGAVLNAAPSPELKTVVKTPIVHKKYFQGERERFGYNPAFVPNVVTFGPDNEPYIRTIGEKPVIQTLDKNGNWINLDFTGAIKKQFPKWNGVIKNGDFTDERIIFDDSGNAYMIVETGRSNLHRALLLFSKDRCRTWKIYRLPGKEFYRLEGRRGHNQLNHPPVIVHGDNKKHALEIIVPRINSKGDISLSKPVIVSDNSLFTAIHSGGECVESVGDKVYIVWARVEKKTEIDGSTPQCIAVYDRKTGKVSKPVLLGANGIEEKPDPHNLPSMAIDSKGYIHVILGAHHHPFKYTRSLKPLDINGGWTSPVYIGKQKTKRRQGSYTYAALYCDQKDNLHLISRWAGNRYLFRLVYMRKKPGENWEEQQCLVEPFHNNYACWYHKLTADRKDRLFLKYRTYINHFDRKTLEAYDKKWPQEKIKDKQRGKWRGNPRHQIGKFKVKAHDPVILMSDDNGQTWRIAITKDFRQ